MKNKPSYEDLLLKLQRLEEKLEHKKSGLSDMEEEYYLNINNQKVYYSVIEWDLNQTVISCSTSIAEITGYSSSELSGKNLKRFLIAPTSLYPFNSILEKINDSPSFINIELISKDDNKIDTQFYSTPVLNYQGQVIAIKSLVLQNSVSTKTARLETDDFSDRSKVLSKAAVDALLIVRKGKCVEANSAACELLGMHYNDLVGISIETLFHKKDTTQLNALLSSDKIAADELFAISQKGEEIYTEVIAKNFVFKNKKARVLAVRDISFRNKKINEGINFKELFENAGFGMILWNNNGQLVSANKRLCEMLGRNKKDIINKPVNAIFSERLFGHASFEWDNLETGKSLIEELELKQLSGTTLDVEVNSKMVSEEYAISLFRDLTHQKEIELELENKNQILVQEKDKAEERDRLKSVFLANMSHEIRTPMNGIIGFSELLKEEDLEEDKRNDYIDIVINSSNQLMQIIDDILEISRLETRKVKVKYSELSLNSLLLEVFNLYNEKAKANNTPLYIKKGLNDMDSLISTDGTKIRKIIYNLIDNALRYTNEGYIELGYERKGEKVEFYVQDTGIGVKEEQLTTIFGRFSQGEKKLSQQKGGLGIGLSIAKENTELLGGKIWVESVYGQGSRFIFTIPFSPVNSVEEHAVYKNTVLVAEDEEINSLCLQILLTKYNSQIKVLEAKNGLEAMELCKKHPEINLILMDVKMPIMDGLAATKKLREMNVDIPIIAQTASITSEDKRNAIDAGCNGFVTKPIKKDALVKILDEYLEMEVIED